MAIELTDAKWIQHAKAASERIRYLRENFPSARTVNLCFVPSTHEFGHIHIMQWGDTLVGRELTTYYVGTPNGQA